MRITYEELQETFTRVLIKLSFSEERATLCANIFAANSRDGVYSHGLNRFPVFVEYVKEGLVIPDAEPIQVSENGVTQVWDGHLAPGMYTATIAMQKAIELAGANGIGCVSVRNTNHWMRGGTYGWQAADAGCIGICASNTIAIMPPWGGADPKLGNNPLIIAVPRTRGHLVLDMAMSQFSYGKMQEYELSNKPLPVDGGYDTQGNLSRDPVAIKTSKRSLPIGFWKGSGLSFMLDILLTSLSGGRSTPVITAGGKEFGLSQFFLCIQPAHLDEGLIEEIVKYTQSSTPVEQGKSVRYPGQSTLNTRIDNLKNGIPVNEAIWQTVLQMQ
ncbi:3-dehydro-L-gulonate 2-dehydrogenase [Segetibacter sp. 3557_3]|uniref:3-dehydro-L-gulonate 2-dehydrogenase n=1 Tax=Segetibacter sp. 3557_3 TaxID=2547429 RepID=UPI001058C905|nr:3-dehydro-L-gulonate 2-dehydrogenase [Segetibacter sp. 3557_3]TDH26513.1 3-dehydro-L-gulonate 2-dehydrogenase [Segetibacter sp. 3557_3]